MQYIQVNMPTLPWLLLLCSMRVHFSVLHQEVIALNEIVLYGEEGEGEGEGEERGEGKGRGGGGGGERRERGGRGREGRRGEGKMGRGERRGLFDSTMSLLAARLQPDIPGPLCEKALITAS